MKGDYPCGLVLVAPSKTCLKCRFISIHFFQNCIGVLLPMVFHTMKVKINKMNGRQNLLYFHTYYPNFCFFPSFVSRLGL